MCELEYGTTPSLLDSKGPRPTLPTIECARTQLAGGMASIAVKYGLLGSSPSMLDGTPLRKRGVKKSEPF